MRFRRIVSWQPFVLSDDGRAWRIGDKKSSAPGRLIDLRTEWFPFKGDQTSGNHAWVTLKIEHRASCKFLLRELVLRVFAPGPIPDRSVSGYVQGATDEDRHPSPALANALWEPFTGKDWSFRVIEQAREKRRRFLAPPDLPWWDFDEAYVDEFFEIAT